MTADEIKDALIRCFTEKKNCRITDKKGNVVDIQAYTLNVMGPTITGKPADGDDVSIPLESITNVEIL